MKILILFILLHLISCGYPDIDSVPEFNELNLTDEELFDLCQFSSTDKSELDRCINTKSNN